MSQIKDSVIQALIDSNNRLRTKNAQLMEVNKQSAKAIEFYALKVTDLEKQLNKQKGKPELVTIIIDRIAPYGGKE